MTLCAGDRLTSGALRGSVLCVSAWLGIAGCAREVAQREISVRDSSGVEIVSNPATVADSACVTVESAPAVTIGGAEAEGPYDLLVVGGVLRVSGGGFVVLNAGTSELRFFDATGRYVRAAGRRGDGPGEFRFPLRVYWSGRDTLLVSDPLGSRLTLLDTLGVVVRTITLRDVLGYSLEGRLSDGSFIASTQPVHRSGGVTGIRRDTVRLIRFSRDGGLSDTLGSFLGSEVFVESTERSPNVTSVPFGPSTQFQLHGDSVYVGSNASYRIRVLDGSGRLVRLIERQHPPVRIPRKNIELAKAERRAGQTDPAYLAMLDRLFDRADLPREMPAFSRFQVDVDGWLWVRRSAIPVDTLAAWDLFDAGGRLTCSVRLPWGFNVNEIGPDYVLGVVRDSDGIEQVRMYRMHRARDRARLAVPLP